MSNSPTVEWEVTKPGWHTLHKVGGVCKEADGWWHAYPIATDGSIGSFRTAKEAKRAVEDYMLAYHFG